MPEVMTTALAETDRGAISDEAVDHFLKLAEKKGTVVVVGPGLTSDDERTRRFVRGIVERPIDTMRDRRRWIELSRSMATRSQRVPRHPLVLTPHPGEMLDSSDETRLAIA